MTQPQTMTVEQTEILGRATEVESPLPTLPNVTPLKPCGLKAADTAARQLVLSANNMLSYLQAGHQEWTRLATSMRNAAKAYGEVDETGAAAMTSGGAIADETDLLNSGDTGSAALNDTQAATAPGPDFTDLKTAATLIAQPDQAASLRAFASQWIDYNLTLQELVTRFRSFQNWEGDAATAVSASMDQQNQWVIFMAKLSVSMAKQAQFVADLHNWAVASHPQLADVVGLERAYAEATSDDVRQQIMKVYYDYQTKSTEVLSDYNSKAMLDPINPPKPPAAVKIDAPPPPTPQGLIPGQVMSMITGGGSGTGMPQMPMMPMSGSSGAGGSSAGTGAALTGAAHAETPKAPSVGGAGMKPMSVGGVGGAGAAAGALGAAPTVGSVQPAAATDVAGAGRGGAASGSGMAGGGMGMPLGAHAGGHGSAKNKSSQQDDDALYKEDRAWTEAVIGNRRSPGGKESK